MEIYVRATKRMNVHFITVDNKQENPRYLVPRNRCFFAGNPSKPPLDRGDLKASPLSRGD